MEFQLTNEKIRAKFGSQFELVNYAIKLAENMIRTGRSPRVRLDSDSVAQFVLAEINAGKDQLVETHYEVEEEHDPYAIFSTLDISADDFANTSDDFDDDFDEDEEVEKPKKGKKK